MCVCVLALFARSIRNSNAVGLVQMGPNFCKYVTIHVYSLYFKYLLPNDINLLYIFILYLWRDITTDLHMKEPTDEVNGNIGFM